MRFQVLSHAGLLIQSRRSVLICDPWLVGSVYWRSWWNYPPVSQDLIASLRPDCIYLTHIHWDHFQGVSLRRFDRTTPVFVPKSPADRRLVEDLSDLGFGNVTEIAHGTSVRLDPQFVITSYHFGLCPDSVLVAECEGVTLVNANDAKLMGPPLRQLLARHMPIDFVFRSHSSANSRLCHEITDDPGTLVDDPAAYVHDFAAFARATGARHAIPFASNHCYLHDETFGFNDSVTTPADVALHGASEEGTPPVTIMVSGDGWSSEQAFELTQHDYFANRAAHLRAYRDSQLAALESSAAREAAAALDFAAIEQYFAALFDAMPLALRFALRRSPVAWVLQAGDRSHTIETDFYRKTVRLREHPLNTERHIEVHVSLYIFQHCITAALFSLMPISKRARFRMQANQMRQVTLLKRTFNLYERGYLPMRRMLSVRFLREWARRWRELLLYAVIASRRLYGRPFRYSDYLRMHEPMTSAAPPRSLV